MRVLWRHSLSTKLFLLMSVCLGTCIAGVSGFYLMRFKDHLRHGLEDATAQRAREIANSAGATFDYWVSLASVPVHYLAATSQADASVYLQSFVSSNHDVMAFAVVKPTDVAARLFAFTQHADDIRMQDKNPEEVAKNLKAFAARWVKDLAKVSGNVQVADLEGSTGLPAMAISVRFQEGASQENLWAVMAVWKTRLLEALPAQGGVVGGVAYADGELLADLHRGDFDPADRDVYVSLLAAADARYGTKMYDSAGTAMLAAVARLERFPLAIVLKQDTRRADDFIHQTLVRTVAWAWVFLLAFVMISFIAAGKTSKRLTQLSETANRIAAGDFGAATAYPGGDEVAALSHSVKDMAAQIQGLLTEKVEAARMEKEMETARLVQEAFVPRADYQSNFINVSGTCLPASECGGDWWGHFTDGGPWHFLVIADATGHGVGAALVTAMGFAGYRTILEMGAKDGDARPSPATILATMHRVLVASGGGKASMTCFVAVLDSRSGLMRYASAGHCPAYLGSSKEGLAPRQTTRGPLKPNENDQLCLLVSPGNPIGLTSVDAHFEDIELQLEPGDRLVLYTDGLTEGASPAGKAWGMRALRKAIHANHKVAAEALKSDILARAAAHFADVVPADDVTVVVVEIADAWSRVQLKVAS